jgi:transcriptional regulator with XRE-family HTH domain
MSPKPLTASQRLGVAMREARTARRFTVAIVASQAGISESAWRRLENGESKNARPDTLVFVLLWAQSRRIRRMGDWEYIDGLWGVRPDPVAAQVPEPDTPETVAAKCASARRIGEIFAEMFK